MLYATSLLKNTQKLLNILTQSIAITDSMFHFSKFLTKNDITFDLTEIERKKRYLVSMKFCCASNAAIYIYIRILEVLPVILTTYLYV